MITFERKIYDSLVGNSLLFFSEALKRLLDKDPHGTGQIDNNLLTLSCAELQISLELAVRATLVELYGIQGVLVSSQKNLPESELEKLYSENKLKVEEFESQKNFLKSGGKCRLTKAEYKEIDRFQIYRNKIVHFTCDFSSQDLSCLRDDVLYYIVHVILVLLADSTTGETPSEFLQSKLGSAEYKRIKGYNPYVRAMERYAQKNSKTVWTCIGCSNRTYSPEEDYCFCCGYETLSGYRRVDCGSCGTKNSVIYDDWDIHNEGNHHTMPGMCLNCEEHTFVFECPECGEAHDTLLNLAGNYCSEGCCVNKKKSKKR